MKKIWNQSLQLLCAATLALSLAACTNADFATDNGSDLTASSSTESKVQEADSASPTASPAKINPLEDDFESSSAAESETSSENGSENTGITNSDVRLHSEPGGSTTGTVPNNTQVTILGKSGDWYQIRYEEQEGYIYGQYLTLSDGSNGLESDDAG